MKDATLSTPPGSVIFNFREHRIKFLVPERQEGALDACYSIYMYT